MQRHPDPQRQRFSQFLPEFAGTPVFRTPPESDYDYDYYDDPPETRTQATVAVAGAARLRVRYKGNAPGLLTLRFVGHDYDPDQPDEPSNGTEFETAGMNLGVVPGVEALIEVECAGEPWFRIAFEADDYDYYGPGSGTHEYCFVSQVR